MGKQHNPEDRLATSVSVTMEMLLFKCVRLACVDEALIQACRSTFDVRNCECFVAWKLHKYDIDEAGSVVRKMEGAGGRIDYHVVAKCTVDLDEVCHDLGYVYHTTHWGQNTYHRKAAFAPSSRALLVARDTRLATAFRIAIASSWLALSTPDSRCRRHGIFLSVGPL